MTDRQDPQPLAPQCVICARHDCEDPRAQHPHTPDRRCGSTCPCTDAGCRRSDVVETLLVCRRCYGRMAEHLRELPELYALAAGEMHPGQGSGGRSTEISIGLRVAALDLRAGGDLLEVLATWERDWREHFDLDPIASGGYRTVVVGRYADGSPVRDGSTYSRSQALDRYARGSGDPVAASVLGVVGFLAAELHRAASAHYAIDEFARDLARLHSAALAASRTTTRPGWTIDCPADTERGICGHRLSVTSANFASDDQADDAEDVVCSRCGRHWDALWLLRVGASDRESEVWAPAEDVALLYGISESTLRRLARRGVVRRESGRYSVDSVREAIEAEKGTRSVSS